MSGTEAVLELKNLGIRFGGLSAVEDLDFKVPAGKIYGLIGPNGAGKTTVFNMLTGVYQPTKGSIHFSSKEITGLKPFQIARKGLARTFQNIRLFKTLSVLDNLLIAADSNPRFRKPNLFSAVLRTKAFLDQEEQKQEWVVSLLKIFALEKLQETDAASLSYGNQRRLEIARALATGARMLLLDEPAAGLNPRETQELMEIIRKLCTDFKLCILLIEHDMKLVMGVCERIAVLDYGKKIAEGTPQEIQKNSEVIEAYLGKGATHGA